jgi:hypothetical protein
MKITPELEARGERARKDAVFLRDFGQDIRELSKTRLASNKDALKSLLHAKATGSPRLTKLGLALLLTPDPITSAAAVPVLIAGRIVGRRKTSDIQRIIEEANMMVSSVSRALSCF